VRRFLKKLLRRKIAEAKGFSIVELVMVIVLAAIAFPVMVAMYTSIYINGHDGELMTMANNLAIQQMEVIIADKAGSGAGYGYSEITTAKYSSVNPPSPFTAFTRTVTVTSVNIAGNASYPGKQIVVRVRHSSIPDIILTHLITDHSGL